MTYIEHKICPLLGAACYRKAQLLKFADYLDIDFDTISQTVNIVVFRHGPPTSGLWDEHISNDGRINRVEVGVLANEVPRKPEEFSLGGFLTVVGEDNKPSTKTNVKRVFSH